MRIPSGSSSRSFHRGSVLILVIAILSLLVVIGTIYVVSARTEQSSARAMSASLNLDLARDAVMNQVRTILFSATTDGEGRIGGLTVDASGARLASRYYDYPEHNGGHAKDCPTIPDQPWLARDMIAAGPNDVCDLGLPTPVPSATTSVLSNNDARACLLSYSSGNNERYRYGVRIIDLSRMGNLNTGSPFPAA